MHSSIQQIIYGMLTMGQGGSNTGDTAQIKQNFCLYLIGNVGSKQINTYCISGGE